MSMEDDLLLISEQQAEKEKAEAQESIEKAAKEPADKETKETADKETKETADKETKETADKEAPAENETVDKAAKDSVSLFLEFLDFAGKPIAGLTYRVVIGKTTYNGATNGKGHATLFSGLTPHQELEVFVRKDNGQFVLKFKGFTACNEMSMCVVSPHIKIEIETELHKGVLGAAPAPKAKPAPTTAPAIPGAGQISSGGKHAEVKHVTGRNDAGNPQAEVKGKTSDWMARHHIPSLLLWSWDDFKSKIGWTTPAIKVAKDQTKLSSDKKVSSTPVTSTPANGQEKSTSANLSVNGKESATLKLSSLDQAAPKEVTELIKIMEEQATWKWSDMLKGTSSAKISTGLADKTFEPTTGKDKNTSDNRCYPSVKIGLLRAKLVNGINGDIPAKGAGPWLEHQGFKDITKSLPDGRWAMPGDVIVYRYTDEIEAANLKKFEKAFKAYEKQKADYAAAKGEYKKELDIWTAGTAQRKNEEAEAKKNKKKYQAPKAPKLGVEPTAPDDHNYGHIDVRSYDGYMSDFMAERLGRAERYVVTGIYRKVFDPLPDLRVRAFLKVLREWECHGIPDEKRYYRLQNSLHGSMYFSNTSTHPYTDSDSKNGSFSGAYQIHYITWNEQVKKFGMPADFSPATQDRIAVSLIEGRLALGRIRKGEIREAITNTNLPKEWSSLPGGSDARNEIRDKKKYTYTIDDLIDRYNEFLNELIRK